MHTAVFDINILVSALIADGKPRHLWLKVAGNELNLVLSGKIRSEFLRVISRKKFQPYLTDRDIIDFVKILDNTARYVRPVRGINAIEEDPDDNLILATAIGGKADFIVSGDRHILDLGEFDSIKIVTVERMLEIVGH
ncbi:MAG: putative toxin-antitoxin system toxin component, PIN family [Thaumarchaeota archaeon]|nr:putative toxin-antitoxin system toxin component, PIN family [Nitrososphaerota archaeon]